MGTPDTHNIFIITIATERIANFWKYTYFNYVTYDNFVDALMAIRGSVITNKTGYYKMFIKGGHYNFSEIYYGCVFNEVICHIELIGDKHSQTIINGHTIHKFFYCYCPWHLTIKNITFYDFNIYLRNYKTNFQSVVYISNCIFTKDSILDIDSVNNIYVTNCTFDSSVIRIRDIHGIVNSNAIEINYTISNNIFCNIDHDKALSLCQCYHPYTIINIDRDKALSLCIWYRPYTIININDILKPAPISNEYVPIYFDTNARLCGNFN